MRKSTYREIYDRLNRQGNEIGHTSFYQNLDALSAQGVIECLERSDGCLYGYMSEPHSHVTCLDTDRIMDVHVELPQALVEAIEAQTGLNITGYQVNFYGTKSGTE